jgi:acetylornithine/succinyldiaminopimelate/putrescine aminotransferase
MAGKRRREWRTRERFGLARSLFHIFYSYQFYQYIADLIGADPKDIIFTSGATETNNMAIKGVARFHKDKKRHIITTQTVCLPCSLHAI